MRLMSAAESMRLEFSSSPGLGLLQNLFAEVWLSVDVRREVFSGFGSADEQAILEQERRGVLRVWPQDAHPGPSCPICRVNQ